MSNPELSDVTPKGELRVGYRNNWTRTRVERIELMRIAEWLQTHYLDCEWEGDFVIAQSSSSGIGTNTIVRCTKCNTTCDVTEYGSW